MNLTIIVPIKAYKVENVIDFVNHYITFSNIIIDKNIQLIIADESAPDVFSYINKILSYNENVIHFIPTDEERTGDNDKSNGIYSAIKFIKYENILIIDDHYRVELSELKIINNYFKEYDVFKVMPKFIKNNIMASIDLCGMFIVNILDKRKQYCGHIALKRNLFTKYGFPCRDSLFDEFAFENHFRKFNCKIGFPENVFLSSVYDITFLKFLEQRVRYSYENFAFPLRFILLLSILPISAFLFIISPIYMFLFIIMLNWFLVIFSYMGQKKYYTSQGYPYISFFAPLWFIHYPITTWIAIILFLRGGVKFGGKRIKKAG